MGFVCVNIEGNIICSLTLTTLLLFQIPVQADLPVGENLMDHPLFYLPISINTSIILTQEKLKSFWEMVKYLSVGKGKG